MCRLYTFAHTIRIHLSFVYDFCKRNFFCCVFQLPCCFEVSVHVRFRVCVRVCMRFIVLLNDGWLPVAAASIASWIVSSSIAIQAWNKKQNGKKLEWKKIYDRASRTTLLANHTEILIQICEDVAGISFSLKFISF